MGYKKPSNRLHREFLYLDHETILNSLSALESGKVDEIILKTNQAREGGFSGGLKAGGVAEVSGGKKRQSTIEEELVRTRTIFSAFDSWFQYLLDGKGIGELDSWDAPTRQQLSVGDTLQFSARLTLHPLHHVVRGFLFFASEAGRQGSLFQQKGQELAETKSNATKMKNIFGDGTGILPVYMAPFGKSEPRILARLFSDFFLSPGEGVNGHYQVIGQIEELLEGSETIPTIRILRDVPPLPIEMGTIDEALKNFVEPAAALGVDIQDHDLALPAPGVLLRPIAIFR